MLGQSISSTTEANYALIKFGHRDIIRTAYLLNCDHCADHQCDGLYDVYRKRDHQRGQCAIHTYKQTDRVICTGERNDSFVVENIEYAVTKENLHIAAAVYSQYRM